MFVANNGGHRLSGHDLYPNGAIECHGVLRLCSGGGFRWGIRLLVYSNRVDPTISPYCSLGDRRDHHDHLHQLEQPIRDAD